MDTVPCPLLGRVTFLSSHPFKGKCYAESATSRQKSLDSIFYLFFLIYFIYFFCLFFNLLFYFFLFFYFLFFFWGGGQNYEVPFEQKSIEYQATNI